MIHYAEGDATTPGAACPTIIAHVCNDIGKWGAGFVLALSARWAEPERRYRKWAAGAIPNAGPLRLGMVQLVPVGDQLWVANLVAQRGVRGAENPVPLQMDALRVALEKLADAAERHGAVVQMPRIGAGYASGKWAAIEPLIEDCLVRRGIAVTVYDLPRAHARESRTQTRSRSPRRGR